MYRVVMTTDIAAAHKLSLPGDSPCSHMHGHNWKVEISVVADALDAHGMVVDFSLLREVVRTLDHKTLNDTLKQPTAERIACYIAAAVSEVISSTRARVNCVTVTETKGSTAEYYPAVKVGKERMYVQN